VHSEPYNYGLNRSEADVGDDEEGVVNRSHVDIESANADDDEGSVNISHISSPIKQIN